MCTNERTKAHNTSNESPWSPPHVEPKKQAQAARYRPLVLHELIAFGWSGLPRFGARLRTRMLHWGNRGRGSLTRVYIDLAALMTRHKRHYNHFWWPIHHPYDSGELMCFSEFSRQLCFPGYSFSLIQVKLYTWPFKGKTSRWAVLETKR